MDLSPRDTAGASAPKKRRNWGAIIVLVGVLGGGGVVVSKFLTSAIDYYCNADEIDVKESCSGDRRIRVQGLVDQGSIVEVKHTDEYEAENPDRIGEPEGPACSQQA